MHHRWYTVLPLNPSNEVVIHGALRQEPAGRRIYLFDEGMWCSTFALGPMLEGREVYRLDEKGADVPAGPDQEAPEAVVYLSGQREEVIARLAREFPHGRLEDTFAPNQPKGYHRGLLVRYIIPPKDLRRAPTSGPRRLLNLREVPPGAWRVLQYHHRYGLGLGVLRGESWVEDPLGPLPLAHPMLPSAAWGEITTPRDGEYRFSVETGNFAVLWVDGRRVLDLRPKYPERPTQVRSVRLTAGTHRVEFRTFFQMGLAFPPVKVRFPGETEERPLGSF
jgi:hypothetical protein